MKKITIVTTAYKSERYLETYFKCISSLTNLDELNICIISNLPNDNEKEIFNKYSNRFPGIFNIVYLNKLETIAQSINRGFQMASNPYVSYLDVDDFRIPDSYLNQMKCLEHNKDIDYTYGDYIVVKKQGEISGKRYNPPEFEKNLFTRGCFVSPTHFFRRSLLDRIGYWDEQYRSGGDFEFQARAAAAGINFKKTDGVLIYYTKEKNSKSASSNHLQPLERTVTELRYGIFDKIDYRYYDKAMEYNVYEVKNGDEWIPVSRLVPKYEQFIEERKYLLPIGKKNHYINMFKRVICQPAKMLHSPQKFYNDIKYHYNIRFNR